MELGKQSLSDLIKNEVLEPKLVNKLIKDCLKGLQELYFQKIVHRDIKPDNILQMPDGSFKITDFGVSRQQDNQEKTMTLIGTPVYFPPEIKKHFNGVSCHLKSEISSTIDWYGFDTYSLGLTFLAAVCKIQKMGSVVNYNNQFKVLEEYKALKKYDPKVYEIIHSMIQDKQEDRPTPGELLLHIEDLEV